MPDRLVRLELIAFRRSFADAFSGFWDRLLLVVVAAAALLAGPPWLAEQRLPYWLAPSAALLLALAWHRAVRARLLWLASESVVAADAAAAGARRRYMLWAHALLFLPLLLLAWLSAGTAAVAAIGSTLLGYFGGVSVAAAWETRPTRPRAVERTRCRVGSASGARAAFRAILSHQAFGSASPERLAAGLLCCVFATTAAAGLAAPPSPAGTALAAAPALLVLLLAGTRLDACLLSFLPSAGFGPGFIALGVAALPAGGLLAASAAILLVRPAEAGWLLLLLFIAHLAVIGTSIFRAWLYPGRAAKSVELQVQVETAAFLLLAMMLPPLAVAAAVWRSMTLHRHHRSLRWFLL